MNKWFLSAATCTYPRRTSNGEKEERNIPFLCGPDKEMWEGPRKCGVLPFSCFHTRSSSFAFLSCFCKFPISPLSVDSISLVVGKRSASSLIVHTRVHTRALSTRLTEGGEGERKTTHFINMARRIKLANREKI